MNERPVAAAAAAPAAAATPRAAPALAARPALSMHIDRVVLEGFRFGARDRGRLQMALQAELARLLSVEGIEAAALGDNRAVACLETGELRLQGARDAAGLARAIARLLLARIAS
jgi:hypothetical protein